MIISLSCSALSTTSVEEASAMTKDAVPSTACDSLYPNRLIRDPGDRSPPSLPV